MHRSVVPANAPVRVGNRWVFDDGTTLPVISGGDGPNDPNPLETANPVDVMVARLNGQIEERNSLIAGITRTALEQNRELNEAEQAQIASAQEVIGGLTRQITPLRESVRVAAENRAALIALDVQLAGARREAGRPQAEYRTAGEWIQDYYAGRMGDRDAWQRIEACARAENRAAAHQTTADNPGLLPTRLVEPIIDGIDADRPLVAAIGPQDLGEGSWAFARVTQHTQVGVQAAEKTELASRKMLVTTTPITAPTYGGYVNISRQDIRRTGGRITDMVISDLGGQYAIETEAAAAAALVATSTNSTTDIPAANPTALQIAQAVWGAAGQSAALLRAQNLPARGPILAVAPDKLGVIGPLFPTVNPQNGFGSGFGADTVPMQGPQGQIANLTVVMATGLAAGRVLFFYRSAVRCFEDRYGLMTVDEPSVAGLQVGVAGDFQCLVINAGGVINIETV